MLGLSEVYVTIIVKVFFSLVALMLMLLVNRGVRRLLKAQISDPAHMNTLYMLARNAVLAVGSIVILFLWLGPSSNLTVAMGVLGAGIAFASQEVIGAFAGYVSIVTGGQFRIGDRVQIGKVQGDVLDISILRTTLMEIGEWVQADQYTGRVVTVANRLVFSEPVFNYTQHWPYLWDEIMIPVTYGSDWRRAGEIMLEQGQTYATHSQAQAQADLKSMSERYPLHGTTVEPTLYIVMTDNWIEITLRFTVEAHERRQVSAQLHHELLQSLESEPKITVASVTMEIVGFPPLRSQAMSDLQSEQQE